MKLRGFRFKIARRNFHIIQLSTVQLISTMLWFMVAVLHLYCFNYKFCTFIHCLYPCSTLGDKYWVFKEVTAEPGYPHSLVELGNCLPREGIDTALRWEPMGKTYFFKGDRYWRYNEDKRATDPGYPKPITVWRGIPQAPQGAFISKEGCMYLQLLYKLHR